MYEFFGRLCELMVWWYRPMRRIARNNRRDMGKMVIHTMIADTVIYGGVWLWLKRSEKKTEAVLFDEEDQFPAEPEPFKHEVTFEQRFGTLKTGDEVIFQHHREHIQGVFVREHDGRLIVRNEDNDFIVSKDNVLDVTPAF